MECTECVRVSTCRVLHEQLEMRCAERHRAVDSDREAFKHELRELFVGRANERAWALVGKIVIALGTIYAAVDKLTSVLPH